MPLLKHPNADRVIDVTPKRATTLRHRGYTDVEGNASTEAPAKSATRAEWDAYAASVGVDSEEYASKDDLIEAVEAL